MLDCVSWYTAYQFGRAVIMPNVPAVTTARILRDYREQIEFATGGSGHPFEPLMTLKLLPSTTPAMIREAQAAGMVAGKVYPAGVTTGSEAGVTDITQLDSVFAEMERLGLVLCLHGECPKRTTPVLAREAFFLADLNRIVYQFPKLKIVLEHISTGVAVDYIKRAPVNVGATITLHHLYLTIDDVLGGGDLGTLGKMRPDYFCAPLPKNYGDRQALIDVVKSGNPKFFYGTDSAPHRKGRKYCPEVCAGIFSEPVAVAALYQKFVEWGVPDRFEDFTSRFGAEFYGLPLNQGQIEIVEESWEVPKVVAREVGGLTPFLEGHTLNYRVV